jgi:hypothetical protein
MEKLDHGLAVADIKWVEWPKRAEFQPYFTV